MTLRDTFSGNRSGPKTAPAQISRRTKLAPGVAGQQAEREALLPVWVRAPKSGVEFYSGQSRAKLYDWAGKGYIRSVSIREPGQLKGVRVFHLESILAFILQCEAVSVAPKDGTKRQEGRRK